MADSLQSSLPALETESVALIFDMDGVVVDSNPAHCEAWIAYNRRFGVETTSEMLSWMYGRRNDEIVRRFFGNSLSQAEVDAHGADKEALFREMAAGKLEQMLVPGLRAFLDRFAGAPTAVASNAEPANINFVLDRANLRPYFQAVVDGSQVGRPKPYPDVFLEAAQRLHADPARCIVFEDSYSGVEAALAAGMRVAGIRTTHPALPGCSIEADNFLSGGLTEWLAAQIGA